MIKLDLSQNFAGKAPDSAFFPAFIFGKLRLLAVATRICLLVVCALDVRHKKVALRPLFNRDFGVLVQSYQLKAPPV